MSMWMKTCPGRFVLTLTVSLGIVGCDQSTTELIEEIDAAREGCTEEMLKNSDEVCVQMFERYAEMGEEALETYIGGMKALDEALRRRGGIQFDTAGIGRVFSDPSLIDGGEGTAPEAVDSASRYLTDAPSWEMDRGPSWSRPDERPAIQPRPSGSPDGAWEDPGSYERARPWDAPADPAAPRRPPAPTVRGTIRPPEERLRRPWIDDSEPSGAYYETRDPLSERHDDRSRDPFFGDPAPAPYPRQ